jgi:hypothetical protein
VITKTTINALKALVAGGGVAATWFAVGPTHGTPSASVASSIQRPAATPEITAEELNSQADKLRDHLNGQLSPSKRNPFRFGSAKSATSDAGTSSAASARSSAIDIAPVMPVAPPPPSYTLAGIAERNVPEGRKRTAVISGEGQLYLVTEGQAVGPRYTVVRVDAEAVLLRDQSGTELVLALR